MRVTWDDVAKVGYLPIREVNSGEVARTVEVDGEPTVLVDLDAAGHQLGVEFLSDVRLSDFVRILEKLGIEIGEVS